MEDDDTTAAEPQVEAANDEVAVAIDNALAMVLGPRRLPVSWLAVVDVMHDDGDQFPVVFYRPEAGWTEALGLIEAGALIVRGSFVDQVRVRDDDGDGDDDDGDDD